MSKPLAVTIVIPDLGTASGHLRPYAGGRWHGELTTGQHSIAIYVNPRRGEN